MSLNFALCSAKSCANVQMCIVFYYTLIYLYLSSELHLWCSTFKAILNLLIFLQKRAVRIIAEVAYLKHTMPLFKDLHIFPFANLYYFCLGQFMYKQIFHTAPVTIIPEVLNRDIHTYCT